MVTIYIYIHYLNMYAHDSHEMSLFFDRFFDHFSSSEVINVVCLGRRIAIKSEVLSCKNDDDT
jgi:hypothetical protein